MKILYKVKATTDFYFAKKNLEVKTGDILEVVGSDKDNLLALDRVEEVKEVEEPKEHKITIKKK